MKKYIGFLIVLSVLVGFSQIQASNTASGVVNDDCTSGTAPWIKVISPAGGETFITGQQIVIKWTSCNVQNVYLSLAQGAHDKGNLVDNMPATPGSYQWTIPFSDPSLPNNNYHVGVFSVNLTPGVQGISGAFNINGTGGITTPIVSAPAITVPTQVTSAQQTVNTKVPEITTNSVNTASSPIFFNRALTVGSQGNDVKALQNILKQKGFLAKRTISTGYYGTQTKDAVKKYQKDANFINATGKIDTNTLKVINGTQAAALSTSVAPVANAEQLVINSNFEQSKVIVPDPTIAPAPTPLPPVNVNPATGDATPRIMFWWGKVNQHIDASGNWQTDADGTSGANLDRLSYCQKYFPNTVSVADYKIEGIGTWQDRGNIQNPNNPSSYYFTLKMSTKCVQGNSGAEIAPKVIPQAIDLTNKIRPLPLIASPSIAVISPNGGETVNVSEPVTVVFQSSNVYPAKHYINLVDETIGKSYSLDSLLGTYGLMLTQAQVSQPQQSIIVSIPSSYDLNTNDKYKIEICVNNVCDKSDNYFKITSLIKNIIPLPVVASVSPTVSCTGPIVLVNTSYANQTTNPNVLNYKIGSFNIQNNCFNESVRVTNLKVGVNQNSTAVPIGDLTNLIIKDYTNNVLTTSIQPSFNNNIAVDFVIPAGQAYVVNIYSNIGSTPTGTVQTNLGYNAVGMTTNVSYPTASSINSVSGQIITIGSGIPVGNNSY